MLTTAWRAALIPIDLQEGRDGMMRRLIRGVAGLFLLVLASAPAPVAAQTLDEIIKRGTVLIGVDTGTPPFGVTDKDQLPDGADIEVAKLVAKDLGVAIEMVPVTGPTRVASLLTGKVDMVISIFGITPERAKSVAFSIPYGTLKAAIFGPKSVDIKSMADLKGKRIGVARGNVMDIELTATAPEGTIFQRFDDEATSNAALLAGQVDAIGIPDHTGVLLARQNPEKQLETKFITRLSPYGIGLRRNDPDLLRWVNTFVFFHKSNGDLARIYEKWVGSPLPELPTF
jgi:polar amino acid transport system substrate-binding protein